MPKKFKPIGTEAQKATWAAMKVAHYKYQDLPTLEREAYKTLTEKSQMCNRDFVTKLILKNYPKFGDSYPGWQLFFDLVDSNTTNIEVRQIYSSSNIASFMTYNETVSLLRWLEISPNLRGKVFRRRWDLSEKIINSHKVEYKRALSGFGSPLNFGYSLTAKKDEGDSFLILKQKLPYTFFVGLGESNNTIGYSLKGKAFDGLGKDLFSVRGYGGFYNGKRWVVAGRGGNTLGWSDDGKVWHGLGDDIFSLWGRAVFSDGNMWVGGGRGSNTLAWSDDGKVWNGLGSSVFTVQGSSLVNALGLWVAGGEGGNSLGWSDDGKVWHGLGTAVFSRGCEGLCFGKGLFVGAGRFNNTLGWSDDGKVWHGSGVGIFPKYGYEVAFVFNRFIAGGNVLGGGSNTLGWSDDGKVWHGLGNAVFSDCVQGFAYDGNIALAFGSGGNSVAWSDDGKVWHGLGEQCFDIRGIQGAAPGESVNYIPPGDADGYYLSGLYDVPFLES